MSSVTPLGIRTSQMGAINRYLGVWPVVLSFNFLWFVKKYTTLPSILLDLIDSLRQVTYR